MTSITNPKAIRAVQLTAQIGAVKMEGLGLRRRGQSVTAMLKKHYGLKRTAKREEVLERLNEEREAIHRELMGSPTNDAQEVAH